MLATIPRVYCVLITNLMLTFISDC